MADNGPLASIAIPAHNGRKRLEQTLDSIARIRTDPRTIEVVIADDGSTDGTAEMLAGRNDPFRLRVYPGDWNSQSAATNEAIVHSTGRFVLLSAQDILFHEELVNRHLTWHERFGDEEVAVLGNLPYPEHLEVTPFMFYLVNGGFQFAYYLIQDPLRVPPNFLYAPNLSLRRSTLERVGLFDKKLPYGCQDTDLGIRLAEAGVRLVYNSEAVGYHNHPIDLKGYFPRQERAAAGRVRLQQKHPYHEGELPCWDVVVGSYMTYPQLQYDRDLAQVEQLEAELLERPDYRELWTRAWNHGEDLSRFQTAERTTLGVVDLLFNTYARLLQFYWARGYLEESLREEGEAKVEAVMHARLSKLQASAAAYRLVEHRLDRHALAPWKYGAAFSSTRIVHGIDSYDDATRALDRYLQTDTPVLDQQPILVVDEGKLTDAELEKLDELVEVVCCADPTEGIREALRRARAEIVTLASARIETNGIRPSVLAEKIFERMPDVAVLGGGVLDTAGNVHYGFQVGPSGAEPLLRRHGEAAGPVPVGAVIPEYLVVRRSSALSAFERPAEGEDWNVALCRRISASGGIVLHVPDCVAALRDAEPAPRAACGAR